MLSNYLKTAVRHLLRHKVYTGINVVGLATGMACTMLILLWVQDEMRFDRFNTHASEIYRILHGKDRVQQRTAGRIDSGAQRPRVADCGAAGLVRVYGGAESALAAAG